MSAFLVAPLEALVSPDLSDPERRVLLALYSFKSKESDTVWPSVDSIAVRANVRDKTRISKITKSLAGKGWLTKKRRGFTGGNEYKLMVPESAKIDDSNLDVDSKLDCGANLGANTNSKLDSETNTNLDSDAKYNEQTIEQTNEQGSAPPPVENFDNSESGTKSEEPAETNPDQQKPPKAEPKPKRSGKKQNLKKWLDETQALGESAIPERDPIHEWCEKAGLPHEFVAVCWQRFKDRYFDDAKQYIDWRSVFRRAAKENWFKLWFVDSESGDIRLTSNGVMAMRVLEAEQRRAS